MYYKGFQSIIDPKEREYTKEPFVRGKYTPFDDLRICYPCWSVGALLELIPMAERGSMELYKDWEYKCTLQNDYYCTPRFNTPIEAAYNMIVWLLENNYIKQ